MARAFALTGSSVEEFCATAKEQRSREVRRILVGIGFRRRWWSQARFRLYSLWRWRQNCRNQETEPQRTQRRRRAQCRLPRCPLWLEPFHCPLNANLQRGISINHGLRKSDCLESRLNLEIKRVIAISGDMRAARRISLKTPPRRFFRAHALENPPRLVQRSRRSQHVLDLISPRKGPAIEKNVSRRIPRQEISSGFHHGLQTEIILRRGIFDFFSREDCVAELVFAQHPPTSPCGKLASKCSLAGTRKPGQ